MTERVDLWHTHHASEALGVTAYAHVLKYINITALASATGEKYTPGRRGAKPPDSIEQGAKPPVR